MVEEAFTPDMGFEAWGSGEWWNEVSPEDLVRVQESVSNAKKIAGQKAKSQRTNKQYALMLSFIFRYVEDEWLLSYVYELMMNHQISTIAIFGHFLPHLQTSMDIAPYKPLYADIWDEVTAREPSLSIIWSYYTDLYQQFPQLQNLPESLYLDMVMKQLEVFGATDGADEDMLKDIRTWLKQDIFVAH